MVDVPVQKRRGRPPKRPVEIIQSDTETPATVVKPVDDPAHDPNPVFEVEAEDAVTGIVTRYPDPGDPVELPDIEAARGLLQSMTFEPSEIYVTEAIALDLGVSQESLDAARAAALSPREVEEAKNVPIMPSDVGIEKPEPVEAVALSPQQVVALDRDYDGEPGGSRPVARLTDLQRDAFMRDVVDAYEGQFEIKRTDQFNRVWTFRHEIEQNRDHMLVECRRGPVIGRRLISTAIFSAGKALVALEEVDGETER